MSLEAFKQQLDIPGPVGHKSHIFTNDQALLLNLISSINR